jgi:hypothetical protein
MKNQNRKYVVCIHADDSSDIEFRKIYEVLEDMNAAKLGYLRVTDESGEDYLYPQECFSQVDLPETSIRALTIAAKLVKKRVQPTRKKLSSKLKVSAARD